MPVRVPLPVPDQAFKARPLLMSMETMQSTRLRGLARTTMLGTFVGAAYDILRLERLTGAAA